MHALFEMDCYASWWLSFIFFFLCFSRVDYCNATDTFKYGEWISDNGTTLVSSRGRFELGFFTPIRSSSHERYVGIWYKHDNQTVVWVANRDSPVPNGSNSTFGISKNGNLVISNSTTEAKTYWSQFVASKSTNRTVKLMDSGNLVISDVDWFTKVQWESFDYPTDTVLPGMNISEFLSLTSWKSDGDPESGQFTFRRDQAEGYYFIRRGRRTDYWRSSWKVGSSDEMPDDIWNLLLNRSNSGNYSYERLVMNYTGELQYYGCSGVGQLGNWSLIWGKPDNNCSIYNFCGNFGSCNINNRPFVCKCLPGFRPTFPNDWDSGDFSNGCTINSTSAYEIRDMFLSLKMMKVCDSTYSFFPDNETECKNECLNDTQCQAYSFRNLSSYNYCMIWIGDVSNLQEEYTTGLNLSIRVAKSVIESTPRNCEPCGSNLIPYPLSTETNCGDRMYFSFYCNDSAGQVSFQTLNGTYRVMNIDPDTRKFVIQDKHAGIPLLNKSLPFNVTTDYNSDSSEVKDEIDISWEPPLEPSCNSTRDCKDWPNSTCNLKKDHEEKRCLCTENFQWNGTTLKCTKGQNAISCA